jgi:hypothetical protein
MLWLMTRGVPGRMEENLESVFESGMHQCSVPERVFESGMHQCSVPESVFESRMYQCSVPGSVFESGMYQCSVPESVWEWYAPVFRSRTLQTSGVNKAILLYMLPLLMPYMLLEYWKFELIYCCCAEHDAC